MFHATLGQSEIHISQSGDLFDRLETVNEWHDLILADKPDTFRTFCKVISQFVSMSDSNCTVQIGT
jgi:hypothetical protein